MRLIFLFSLAIIFLKASASTTDTVSFNGIWKFKTDLYKKGTDEKWFSSSVKKEGWDKMEVPGNWDLHNEYSNYAGDAWYSYEFTAKEDWSEKNVRLVFQSVYNDSDIWLNGEKVGDNHLGFLEFYFDISDKLKPGNNQLVLKVNNVAKRGAIWNWGGIRRPVWLEITNQVRINYLAITAVPDLKTLKSTIDFKVELANYSGSKRKINYLIETFYQSRKVHSTGIIEGRILAPGDSISLSRKISLPAQSTHLWHFDDPQLYTAVVSVYEGKNMLHQFSEHFGIRKIEVDGLKLRLNGQEIRPVGFNLVPEDRVSGNTLPFNRLKLMVDMMKESGANMARLSHMALPKEFLDYLDKKGIMIFEEVSLWGKDVLVDPDHPLPKLWLYKLIRQEYNHPSIIGWSVGNEIGSFNNNPMADAYIKGAIAKAKEMDPLRLAVYVSNTAQAQANDPANYGDLVMQNSYGNWAETAENVHKHFPDKPIFFSEFGENLNSEDPNLSTIDFDKMLNQLRDKAYVIGASLWTFNDYRSTYWSPKPLWETPVSQNRSWGVVNSVLQPKKTYYQIRKQYLPFAFNLSDFDANSRNISGKISVRSRAWNEFPAYQLRGFKVLIHLLNSRNEILDTSEIRLPEMEPGTVLKPFSFKLPNKINANALMIKVLDNQLYNRYDTLIHLTRPARPEILAVHTSKNAVRIIYKKLHSASVYSVRYGTENMDKETAVTINNFIDIKDLKGNREFKFEVLAHNNAGSTSSVQSSLRLNEDELPPIIWGVIPIEKGFVISFSSDPLDYKYEVTYGTVSGKYDKHLTFDNRGVLRIPDLDKDKTYFFKMRRIMQWGFASEWTHDMAVTTK